jgi:hypothetical protein
MNYRGLLLHTYCCIVFICLNSNLCLNSSFVNSFEIAKGFLFPPFYFFASGPGPSQPSTVFPAAQLALISTVAQLVNRSRAAQLSVAQLA